MSCLSGLCVEGSPPAFSRKELGVEGPDVGKGPSRLDLDLLPGFLILWSHVEGADNSLCTISTFSPLVKVNLFSFFLAVRQI